MLAIRQAHHQEKGNGFPSKATERRATRMTLVPRSGVETEMSPVAMARKVKIWPRKKRRPQQAGKTHRNCAEKQAEGAAPTTGINQRIWKRIAMVILQSRLTTRPETPPPRARWMKSAPQAYPNPAPMGSRRATGLTPEEYRRATPSASKPATDRTPAACRSSRSRAGNRIR